METTNTHRKVPLVPYNWLFSPEGPFYANNKKHAESDQQQNPNTEHKQEEVKQNTPSEEQQPEEEESSQHSEDDDEGGWITVGGKHNDEEEEEEEDDWDDNDEESWITPANISDKKKEGVQEEEDWVKTEEPKQQQSVHQPTSTTDSKVGCITQDFAMQNVLMHMGLNLVTGDGKRLKFLKRWVKRCESCSTYVEQNVLATHRF